jgi:hypothetical protein
MAIIASHETLVAQTPEKFRMNEPTKLLTAVKQPPVNAGKGRRRNPIITEMYNHLITNRDTWFHVNLVITDKKQLASIRASLYSRGLKDNLNLSSSSVFNEKTKAYDLWVMLSA